MRNWEYEQVVRKHQVVCYVEPELKQRIKALARAKRMSISQFTSDLIEFALARLETKGNHDHSTSS